MESLRPIGIAVLPPIHAVSMKEIVTLIIIALVALFVDQTIAKLLDYLEAVGLVVQIAASVCFFLK